MSNKIIALSSDCPISPKISFHNPTPGHKINDDLMWGVAWYNVNHGGATVVKDTRLESELVLKTMFDRNPNFLSNTFVGHVHDTDQTRSDLNLQPFVRPYAGREWVLVHNGYLNHGYKSKLILDASDFEPVGTTDSEYILCWFLSQLRKRGVRELTGDNLYFAYDLLKEINECGQANIMITDNNSTIIYQDKDNYDPIYYAHFFPPINYCYIGLNNIYVAVGTEDDSLRTYTVFSTAKSANTGTWQRMFAGQMLVSSRGRIVWNSDINSSNYVPLTENYDDSNSFNEKQQPLLKKGEIVNINRLSETGQRILHVTHETKYLYTNAVNLSKHTVRVKPVEDLNQRILEYSLKTSVDCDSESYEDVFGNDTVFLKTREPYIELSIKMDAKVAIKTSQSKKNSIRRHPNMPIAWMPWQRQMMTPYLLPTELPESQLEELMEYAVSFVRRNNQNIVAILDDINKTIYYEYNYVPNTTNFSTTAYDVYVSRQGVCQDFSNLFICLARLLGIPARYRSGYIFNGGRYENTLMSDATHAWVEVYLPWVGWIGYDPTNGCEVNSDHIRVACGRTYIDATPTSGVIYRGGGGERLFIDVKVFDITANQ